MRKKFNKLGLYSFIIALVIYVLSFILYHYLGPDGRFTSVFQETPVKPFVTLMLAMWGVMFQFAGVMSLLIGKIFYSKEA